MPRLLFYPMLCLLIFNHACKTSPQSKGPMLAASEKVDSLNKIFYPCCNTDEGQIRLEKPKKATVNADQVLVRKGPFDSKGVRVANRGDQVEVYSFVELPPHTFGLLSRNTIYRDQQDTIILRQGRRLFLLWEDTVTHLCKVGVPYGDTTKLYLVVKKNDIEPLQESRWYYIKTKDNTDECILWKYLNIEI